MSRSKKKTGGKVSKKAAKRVAESLSKRKMFSDYKCPNCESGKNSPRSKCPVCGYTGLK